MSRKWALIALLPLLTMFGVVGGSLVYRCSGDGVARTECCCPEHQSPQSNSTAAVSSGCCCDITRLAASMPSEPVVKGSSATSPALEGPAAGQPAVFHGGAVATPSLVEFTPRPPPIPILLRKQSFLI